MRGVVCTSVARTALDLALGKPLPESPVVLDAALRTLVLADDGGPPAEAWRLAADPARVGRARAELEGAYARLAPRRHRWQLHKAVELADPRAETPLESASRGLLLQGGVAAPDLQVWVRGDDGRWYRTDMGWADARVLGEADGRVKYADPSALWEEKRRQEAILGTGDWRALVRWTSEDVWRCPERFLGRVGRALGD